MLNVVHRRQYRAQVLDTYNVFGIIVQTFAPEICTCCEVKDIIRLKRIKSLSDTIHIANIAAEMNIKII
ncbi:hypothetical protein AOA61_06405 [Pseudomonas sp. 2995-1]|nr:hypothetical protein AOA61_06405 [Pseudomonas sp. 2995-1]